MVESAVRDTHEKRRSFDNAVTVDKGDARTRDQIREWYAGAWRIYRSLPDVDLRSEYLSKTEREAKERMSQ